MQARACLILLNCSDFLGIAGRLTPRERSFTVCAVNETPIHDRWLDTPLGRRCLKAEQGLVRQALEHAFGEQFLQIGLWGEHDTFTPLRAYPTNGASRLAPPDGRPGTFRHSCARDYSGVRGRSASSAYAGTGAITSRAAQGGGQGASRGWPGRGAEFQSERPVGPEAGDVIRGISSRSSPSHARVAPGRLAEAPEFRHRQTHALLPYASAGARSPLRYLSAGGLGPPMVSRAGWGVHVERPEADTPHDADQAALAPSSPQCGRRIGETHDELAPRPQVAMKAVTAYNRWRMPRKPGSRRLGRHSALRR